MGATGQLPSFRARAVRGAMTGAEALNRLLAGSGYRAVQVGPLAYRIEPVPAPRAVPAARPTPPAVTVPPVTPPDIVVTAQKRSQSLAQLPLSIAIVSPETAVAGRIAPGSRDLALAIEGLAITNLGPGRNRQFIRGVADSPFNGTSQSTVAVQLDEARITFDAPDPDLRLVDVEKVEILKGPQGPLYGSGALGGIYRIVTRKPDLHDASASLATAAEVVQHGEIGFGGEAVFNLPLSDDRLALRAVGYGVRRGGWIDNVGRSANANRSSIEGGRLALRWKPFSDWTVDLAGVLQNINVKDSQYVMVSDDTLKRTARIPERADNAFRALNGTIEGRLGALNLLSATSYVHHAVAYTLDASAAAGAFGVTDPVTFQDDRAYEILNQELRLSPVNGGGWIAGASVLRARSHNVAIIDNRVLDPFPVETLDRKVTEYAVFGEGGLDLLPRVRATAGARLFHTVAEDEATEQAGGRAQRISKTGITPSLSISWTPRTGQIVYLRYARAFRPGGLAPSGEAVSRQFDSDELGTFDLGARSTSADGQLSLAASLYYTDWQNIQSDQLLANGLVSTRNVGHGKIIGGEASADWHLRPTLLLSAGFSAQRANLVATQAGIELEDRRLPVAPNITARLSLAQDFDIGGARASVKAQANYVGRARLTFDEGLDRQMGNFATVSSVATLATSGVLLSARIDNMFDIKGDSFAFGNPFSIREGRQFTPLRPRTLTLSVRRSW